MSTHRSGFFAAIGGCLFGAMIPLLLGAAQAPEKQFPRFAVSFRGDRNQQYVIVDNQKDLLHLYYQTSSFNLELYKTFDLSKVGEKQLECQFDKFDDLHKQHQQPQEQSIEVLPEVLPEAARND